MNIDHADRSQRRVSTNPAPPGVEHAMVALDSGRIAMPCGNARAKERARNEVRAKDGQRLEIPGPQLRVRGVVPRLRRDDEIGDTPSLAELCVIRKEILPEDLELAIARQVNVRPRDFGRVLELQEPGRASRDVASVDMLAREDAARIDEVMDGYTAVVGKYEHRHILSVREPVDHL